MKIHLKSKIIKNAIMDNQIKSFSKKIYKLDTTGKVRVLHVYTKNSDVIQNSGVHGSENMINHSHTCEGKNTGKSNETTSEQQAILEAISKIENKMSTGYFNTVEEAKNNIVILPMLAKDYKKEFKKIKYPCAVQPKLDGMRALYNSKKGFISRKGKSIDTMVHIESILQKYSNVLKDNHLDGELYVHNESFQANMRLIKKNRGEETQKVKFCVYDIVLDIPFVDRFNILLDLASNIDGFELVKTYIVSDEESLKSLHIKFISDGYEGTIVRHSDAGYGINKRDSQLLKYKDFIDVACEVVDIVPSDKNPLQGVVHCISGNGTFGCGMKFSHKEREEILANKDHYIGQTAEIRFFEYSEDGTPRFPVCHGFRLDK
jgi:ATP-dependent DNA ligase